MIVTSMLALVFLQSNPKLIAVQQWDESHPIKAWTPEGKPLSKTIAIDRADFGLPSKSGATELIAAISCPPAEDPPYAYWTQVYAFKRQSPSESWKDNDPKSGVWLFSLLGFGVAKEASGIINVASGPMRVTVGPKTLKLRTWTNIGNGFHARVQNRIYKNDDGDHIKRAFLEIALPPKYQHWDIHPLLKSRGQKVWEVSFDVYGKKAQYRMEKSLSEPITLTISARPYHPYRFNHIPLRPR